MIGDPGFAAAVFARDIIIIFLVVALLLGAVGLGFVGAFHLLTLLFGVAA